MGAEGLNKILKKCNQVSQVLRSISHPVRLRVLCQLAESEMSVNELTRFCGISQSAMSQFLSRMKAEGLLQSRRERQKIFYFLEKSRSHELGKLLIAIKGIYCPKK